MPSDPATAGGDTEGLREALCALMWAQRHPHERLTWAEIVKIADRHPRNMGAMRVGALRKDAGALIAGPLADFLARASAEQARVEAERDEREAWAAAWHRVVETTLILMDLSPALGGDEAATAIQTALAKLTAERDRLLIAFHDAIRRPLGVTPDSGAEFYDYRMANEAEARRPRHGSPEERAERPEIRIAAALAALDDACRMSSILLMVGEMTAQERRTARAVANGITAKVRSALTTHPDPREDAGDA